VPNILLIERMNKNFNKRVEVSYEYLVTNNDARIDQFDELTAEGNEIETELLAGPLAEEVEFAIEKTNDWTGDVRKNVLEQNQLGNDLVASTYLNSLKPETIQVNNAYDDIIARIEGQITLETDDLQRIQLISVVVTVVIGVIGVILSLIVSYRTTDSLTGRIGLIKERLERIANGDFSSGPLASESKDELGDLGRSLNVTQDYLIMLITNIQNASQTLDGSSNELYATGEEVQQGTQQIAATMEELASGTELQANSASNLANEMNTLIDEIASISQESAAGVEETTASVEEINSSMEEVGQQSETLLNITGDLREFTSNVKI
ncbi:MAG TPA: methyl-accepting chemotaxis protein, partial [Atopostipes sp.]|nr:methyl-accepting chemotaxis protein [Atopostipes sp.]